MAKHMVYPEKVPRAPGAPGWRGLSHHESRRAPECPSPAGQQRTEAGLKLEPAHRGGFCPETNQAGTAKTETLTLSGEFGHQLGVQSTQREPCLFTASSLQQDFWDTSFVAGTSSSFRFIPKSYSMVYTASRLSFQLLRNIRVVQVLGFCEQSCLYTTFVYKSLSGHDFDSPG